MGWRDLGAETWGSSVGSSPDLSLPQRLTQKVWEQFRDLGIRGVEPRQAAVASHTQRGSGLGAGRTESGRQTVGRVQCVHGLQIKISLAQGSRTSFSEAV